METAAELRAELDRLRRLLRGIRDDAVTAQLRKMIDELERRLAEIESHRE